MIKITACVIVKNEAQNIRHWLECVRPIADEIIVVDTGSTDNTVELAKQGGAKTEFFAWCDDFAAAKNYALSKATGQWIIFLDADEYFSPQTLPNVRRIIEDYQRNPKIVGVICLLVNIDKDDNNRFCGTASQVRIFRNLPSLRYEGKVHEKLVNRQNSNRRFELSRELEIYHTGYSAGIQRQKLERNLKILQAGGETETEANALAMMDCYYGLEEYEKAIPYAERAINSELRYVGLETHPYEVLISIYYKIRSLEETLLIVEKAKKAFPAAAAFWVYEGIFRYNQHDYLAAEQQFLAAIELCQQDQTIEKLKTCLSDNGSNHMPVIYQYLGQLKQLRLDLAGAAEYYFKSLNLFPYREESLHNLLTCLADVEPTELIGLLNTIYDKQNDAPFLCKILRPAKEKDVYIYYSRQGNIRNQTAEYLAVGRADAAAAQLADEVERLYSLGFFAAREMKLPPQCELWTLLPEQYRQQWGKKSESYEQNRQEDRKPLSLREVSQKLPRLRQLVLERNWQQVTDLAEAIESAGHLDVHTLEELAGAYIDAQVADDAERVTMALLEKKPSDGYVLFLRSRARFLFKDYAETIQLAEQALDSGTLDQHQKILALDVIAKACKESGQAERATNVYWQTIGLADSVETKRQQYDNYLLSLHYSAANGQLFKQRALEYNSIFKDIEPCRLEEHRHKKIRIGYVSPDFCKHVMSNFSRGLLKEYDRQAFEVYAYDTGTFYDEITKEFEVYPDVWRDISQMTDIEAAQQIVADEIDILVDLAGHTQGNRLGMFAYKPAPVQISGIGYMSTTGLQAIDYFFGDRYLDDEISQEDFTEKLIVLPHSHFLYLPWNAPAETNIVPCETKGYVTFGCFNNFTKVSDEILHLWGQILVQVPNSRLFLKAAAFDDVYSRQRAEQRLQAVGISLDRVELEGWSNDYFAAYAKMDIALDTYPYPGGGTTCDALYMGVPVISLAGSRHGTRFGYSLLSNVGLGDLCAWTADEYVDKAVQLANNLPYLQELHFILRQRFKTSALGNAELYMADLEAAYQRIWAGYLEQKKNSI